MLSFDIINIHIIALGSQIGESVHHGLIYYIIETHTFEIRRECFFSMWDKYFFFLYSFTNYIKNPPLVCNEYLFT
jgi:hypothetical protein